MMNLPHTAAGATPPDPRDALRAAYATARSSRSVLWRDPFGWTPPARDPNVGGGGVQWRDAFAWAGRAERDSGGDGIPPLAQSHQSVRR